MLRDVASVDVVLLVDINGNGNVTKTKAAKWTMAKNLRYKPWNEPPAFTFSKWRRTYSFHVVVLQRTAKKCADISNARAQPLFFSLNRWPFGVFVAVAVLVFYGDAEDDVDLKTNLYFTYESRDTLKSFSLFLTVETISKLNMERSVKVGILILKISRRRSYPPDNAEFGHFIV